MNNAVQVVRTLFLRLRFIFVFIAIGLVVGNWAWIQNVVDRLTRPASSDEAVAGDVEWFCPMHPTVVRPDSKTKCPICGMPLSKRKHGVHETLPSGVLSRLQLTPFRIQQAGVSTEAISLRPLARDIRTAGTLDWDERRYSHISARVAGRADELFINFTGIRVKKGDPVYRLYSPDLVSTQEEYLLALQGLETAKAAGGETVQRARRLADSTRERLHLWGVTDSQVEDLEKTKKAQTHLTIVSPTSGIVVKKDIHAGHQVIVGEDPYTLVDDSVMWMQADLFERDLPVIKLEQPVEISSESWSGPPIQGRTVFIAPTVDPETRTTKIRVEVPNPNGLLKAGMFVTATFKVEFGDVPSIPVSAVIDTGIRKVAFIQREPGTFDSVEVFVGPRAGEYYPVLKGLAAGDRVVVQGAFLLDAETRLNPAAAAAYFGAEMKK